MMVRLGPADGSVAGAVNTTADTVRAAIQVIGLDPRYSLVSSFFVMMLCEAHHDDLKGSAMLSFSTGGSARHPLVEKVVTATRLAQRRRPELMIEGDVQLDASIVPEISIRKAPGSVVKGRANVLIVPDLEAGNIGYKIAERMGKAKAIGPVLQGLASQRPLSWLHRRGRVPPDRCDGGAGGPPGKLAASCPGPFGEDQLRRLGFSQSFTREIAHAR